MLCSPPVPVCAWIFHVIDVILFDTFCRGDGSFYRAKAVNWRKHFFKFRARGTFVFSVIACLSDLFPIQKVAHQRRVAGFLLGRIAEITGMREHLLAKRPYFVFWVSGTMAAYLKRG